MSASKLTKYLNDNPPVQIQQHSLKLKVPIVLGDSKGLRLKDHATSRIGNNILWWCESGRSSKDAYNWLNENLRQKIRLLGSVHIYIFVGTCDFTSKSKNGYIHLNHSDSVPDSIYYYKEIIKLVKSFQQSEATILETPIFSIARYNRSIENKKAGKRESSKPLDASGLNDDRDLQSRILNLNAQTKVINQQNQLNIPAFNVDIYKSSKVKSQGRQGPSTPQIKTSYGLYSDGIHPSSQLAKVWLRKIEKQVYRDCWSH